MAEKVENYTAAQTAELVAAYTAATDEAKRKAVVESFAKTLGKTAKSVIAKLVRERVYVKKEYVTKTGQPPVKKDEHADAIGKILRMSEPETDSLAKANKAALEKIVKALANSVPIEPETDGEKMAKSEAIAAIRASVADLTESEIASLERARGMALAKIAAALADMED